MKNLVIFSGAGISAESGLKTFRDSNGLWENYDVSEVATPEAWQKDFEMVLHFYNLRRKQVLEASPNEAHACIEQLQSKFNLKVITQNIDDLHERGGANDVLHLHGEIVKSRSTLTDKVYPIDGYEIKAGDVCEEGAQLRPHVVWFGEAVPAMEEAIEICQTADIFIIVGTSLNVYPAAGLINYVPNHCQKYLIDPKAVSLQQDDVITIISTASEGLPKLVEELLNQ